MTGSSRSVIGSKGGQRSKWQRAAGAKVAARRRAAEVSGRESVRRVGKLHMRFAKASAQVWGSEASELSSRESAKVGARLWTRSCVLCMSRALSGFERSGARGRYQSRELAGGVIFELRKIQRSNYRLNTRARARGGESGSTGEPCTVRRDCG